MTLQIDRRAFLHSLIAAGAIYVLPAKATKAQVDQVWAEAEANPWFFEVNADGTLVEADVVEPAVWEDIYDCIQTTYFDDPESIISEVKGCMPLVSYLGHELDKEIENLEENLDTDPPESKKEQNTLKKKIQALKEFRDEYEHPWMDWVELEGKKGVAKFKEMVDDWLQEPVDWMQSDWFPEYSGSQGAAMGFFQDQPTELLKALGVVVIEGEHPGSTYYAAELRGSIEEANTTAERLGLPFRFKPERPPALEVVLVPPWQPSKLAIAISGTDDLDALRKIDDAIGKIPEGELKTQLPDELSAIVDQFIAKLPPVQGTIGGWGRNMKKMHFRTYVKTFVHICGRQPDAHELVLLWDAT